MDKKIALVMYDFLELDENEKREIIDNINTYYQRDSNGKRLLRENISFQAGVTFGPLTTPCPRCGK